MGWAYLMLAGLFEVGFTTAMRYTHSVRFDWPNLAFVVCVVLSFGFLQEAQKTIPLGTAYAVWVGIGAVGTAIAAVFLFNEPVSAMRVLGVLLILAGIAALKFA